MKKVKKDKQNFSKFSDEKILKLSGIIENSTGVIYPTLSGIMMFGEYPMKALREAVANALIHRDYSISRESAYIYVQIYDDRIEIINPGDLYGNNRIENLGTDMMLEARNKNIVRLLEEKGDIIENRHTGIATMREEMRKMGLPEPEFESLRGDFKVTFRKEKVKISEQNKNQEFTEKFTERFSESEQKILNELIKNPYITQIQLSEILGISKRSIIKNMKNLKDKNKIKRIGSDRKGYWEILK